MAGTRLLIQGVVVVEVLLAAVLAFWFGLCSKNDSLCLPILRLFSYDASGDWERSMCGSKQQELHLAFSACRNTILDGVPPARIYVANPDVMREWKIATQNTTIDRLDVTMNGMVLDKVCPDLMASEQIAGTRTAGPALYVCDHEKTERIVKSKTSIAVYPDGFNTAQGTLSRILPPTQNQSYRRKNLFLTVAYHQSTDQQSWLNVSQLVQHWSNTFRSTAAPYINQYQARTCFAGILGSQAMPYNAEENANTSTPVFVLKQSSIATFLDSTDAPRCNTPSSQLDGLCVTLYLSPTQHLRILHTNNVQKRVLSDALQVDERTLFALVDPSSTLETLTNGLTPLVAEFIRTQACGMESNAPMWYNAVWLQRTVKALQREADEKYKEATDLLSMTCTWSQNPVFSRDSLELWMKVRTLLEKAVRRSRTGDALGAMELMEDALSTLDRVLARFQSRTIPEKDFPPEQALAIFAPLLFPLLIPMIAGLRREFKRYKELQDKKKT